MKEKDIFIGIDVSKATIDIYLLEPGKSETFRLKNQPKSIKAFFDKLLNKFTGYDISICMEHTGYYNWPCYEVFETLPVKLYVVNPLHLKRSMGLVRGKNDAIDAGRIAKFIAVHHLSLKPTSIPRRQIRLLQALVAQRKRLVDVKQTLNVACNELISMSDKAACKTIHRSTQAAIKTIKKQILQIEKQITELITADQSLSQTYKYLISVQGVGKVLAWSLLIKTNEFKSINDPRKLACYAGVVPFQFQSGTSINKRPRVSVMADKALKKLLHMAAMRVIQLKGDLQTYYQRKVAEGKNKMLVLNAVRNKLVARICSVVNNQKIYQTNLNLS